MSQEVECKRALSMVLSQTKQQERKDAEVLAEAKRITESCMAAEGPEESESPVAANIGPENSQRAAVTGDAVTPSNATLPFVNINGRQCLRMLCVYLRTYVLDQIVQAASAFAGLWTIKRVEQTLQELGVNLKTKVPTKAVCVEHLELRKEILTLLNLQKQRTSCGDQNRPFMPDPLSFGGDRFGKSDQKRKAPGRTSEPAQSPSQSKRPRKMKASDI